MNISPIKNTSSFCAADSIANITESKKLEPKREVSINIESKNEATHAEYSRLETKRLESKRETTINTESKVDFSKRDSKNNDEVRFDSNGDEIMYEIWHNLTWWDYFLISILFIFGITMLYGGVLIFGIPATLMGVNSLFYMRKNRFYITTQGIGFERRKWFRMQRGFYRFGEVGVIETSISLGLYPANPPRLISIFPLGTIKSKFFFVWQLKPYCVIPLIAWNCYLSQKIYNKAIDAYHLHDFLIKKTKEALEAKGIATKTLCYDLEKQFDI